jgi:hypothetical protein
MLPELTTGRGGGMGFAAVLARSGVGAWGAVHSRWGGVTFTIAAVTKRAMVLFTMGALTDGADNARIVAEIRVMTPRITAGAEGHADFHGCPSEVAYRRPNIERTVDEGFHTRAGLGVPYVEVYGAGVRTP